MSFKHKTQKQAATAKIRIIGGRWRGTKLPIIDAQGLRPSGDRLRETLFNWLAPHVHGAHVLDCFAGSGALGLEALSRGARHCNFIELNAKVAQLLRQNTALLEAPSHVVHGDFLRWSHAEDAPAVDLMFIDPPFAGNLWQASIHHVQSCIRLSPNAHIYIECPKDQPIEVPTSWHVSKDKVIGHVRATLYQYDTSR